MFKQPLPIFNSLGSNYSWEFVWLALTQVFLPNKTTLTQLKEALTINSNDKIIFTYKGRDAIELALKGFGVQNHDQVLTQAFTCHAIEEAIKRTGAEPVYVDVDTQTWNPTPKQLDVALKKAPHAKAVIIQHTLGLPAEIEAIQKWCKRHNLFLIEDLAQAYGAKDQSGQVLGMWGDATVLSFGRDKILDGVSGGAVIFKTDPLIRDVLDPLPLPPFTAQIKDLLYPLITWLSRKTYNYGGKLLVWTAKKCGLITSPVASPTKEAKALPSSLAALVLWQLRHLESQLQHRTFLAQLYLKELTTLKNEAIKPLVDDSVIARASNLRWSVALNKPQAVAQKLQLKHIFITDRWYRKPVDSGALNFAHSYLPGSCPQAEQLAQTILNLPTHRGITTQSVEIIVSELNKATLS
jgi:perosamine synthetase